MNLPNLLTLVRIFLVPAFLIAITYQQLALALGLFLTAAVTDLFDGFLARRLGQESALGLYLDPLADKLLISVSYVALAVQGLLPAWLAILVVFRDLFLALGTGIAYLARLSLDVAPSRWGKLTTLLQVASAGVALAAALAGLVDTRLTALYLLTGALTIASGCHYILGSLRRMSTTAPPEPPW